MRFAKLLFLATCLGFPVIASASTFHYNSFSYDGVDPNDGTQQDGDYNTQTEAKTACLEEYNSIVVSCEESGGKIDLIYEACGTVQDPASTEQPSYYVYDFKCAGADAEQPVDFIDVGVDIVDGTVDAVIDETSGNEGAGEEIGSGGEEPVEMPEPEFEPESEPVFEPTPEE
jgi:hypothetical protein